MAGSCIPDVKLEDGIEASATKLEELDEELINLDVMQYRLTKGWDFMKNVEGVFCLHLAVCLNRKEVAKHIHSLRNTVTTGLFCFTPRHRFSYIHVAVELEMNEMAKLLLQELKTLTTFDSYFKKVSTLIIEQGNKEMCKILISSLIEGPNQRFDIRLELNELLELMKTQQKYDCLPTVVAAMKQVSYSASEKNLCKKFYGDRQIMTSLLNGTFLLPQVLLEIAVEEDDVPTVQWLTGMCKIEKVDNSVLVKATLNNSPEILKSILKASITVGIHSNPAFLFKLLEMKSQNSHHDSTIEDSGVSENELFEDYTALDWAVALDFQECTAVLREHKQRSDPAIYKFCHPFSAVNYVQSSKFDTAALITRLLNNGFTVHQCMELWKKYPTSRSPLYFAIMQQDMDVIILLLSNGADLEIWNDIFRCPFQPNILERFLYHNANICTSKGSIVNQILKSELNVSNISAYLRLVLELAYATHKEDVDKIGNFCVENEITWFDSYCSPSSLLSLCRKSFRRFCGYRIHEVVEAISIPSSIRGFLLLTEELNNF
ncbi:hypothetical protein FSP39_013060 [Pinctada imbricata]|uniref:SOCS box domain-containing protein n=1 Tax=Pinctada imbricata TaxID=66713 RepID=A0AA89C3F8_PINIB|nr:hypothetical protein FSP39_013060 [Pinctada imbricata]